MRHCRRYSGNDSQLSGIVCDRRWPGREALTQQVCRRRGLRFGSWQPGKYSLLRASRSLHAGVLGLDCPTSLGANLRHSTSTGNAWKRKGLRLATAQALVNAGFHSVDDPTARQARKPQPSERWQEPYSGRRASRSTEHRRPTATVQQRVCHLLAAWSPRQC